MESDETQNNSYSENEDQFETPHEDFEYEEQNTKLEERLNSLKETMSSLKEQLHEEKEAWKKEMEEALTVAKTVGVSCNCDHECYNQRTPSVKSDVEIQSSISEPTLTETSLLNYEQKLASYQEALMKAHTQKRNLIKRQLAANAFKRRLLEVENMCNMELLKVKRNMQHLQSLQTLATNWQPQSNMVENVSNFDEELTGKSAKAIEQNVPCKSSGGDSNFVTMENIEQRIINDFKEISSQMTPLSMHATCSSPRIIDEDADLMMQRVRSLNWYSNDLGDMVQHSAINPLM